MDASAREEAAAEAVESGGPDAADEALLRARAVARGRGLRPGAPARRTIRGTATTSARGGDRDPALIGAVVDKLVNDRGWEHQVDVGGVTGRWPEIVGPDLAANATPETFTDGILVIRASSTAWATQLRLLESTLLQRIAEETGPDVVLELHILGPTAPSWSHGRRSITGARGPRDTYG